MSERTPLLSRDAGEVSALLSRLDYVLILPALLMNMFLAAFESTIAASTQGAVGASFHASKDIAWVATSYLLVSTAIQPLYGRASDIFGRTAVYIFSLSFFGIGCLGCGLSRSLGEMIAARAVCGIGGGGLITISQICAWDLLPVRHRPLYQAVNNLTYGLGAAIGATIGGLLADSVGWWWGYLAPVPLSVLSIVIFLTRARPKLAIVFAQKTKSSFRWADLDTLGSGLLMTSITLLMLVINVGGNQISWTSYLIPLLFTSFVLSTILFIKHEKLHALPVLPLKLLHTRHMIGQVGLNLFGAMTIFGTLYSIPIYFQSVTLASAATSSRRLLYPTLTAPAGSILTGLYLHRHRDRAWLAQSLGAGLMVIGAVAMLVLTYEDAGKGRARAEGWYLLHLIWVHLGMGLAFIASVLDILSVSGSDHASATSLIFLIRSLGTVFGIAGSQAIIQNVLSHQLAKRLVGTDRKWIDIIRDSLEIIPRLPKNIREVAIESYSVAFRASFIGLIVMATLALLSVGFGLTGSKRKCEEGDAENV